jgi:hypothetical protein
VPAEQDSDRPRRRVRERVHPALAVARIDLRQISLLAVYEMLPHHRQAAVSSEHATAIAAGRAMIDRYASAPEHSLTGTARLFFHHYFVAPNTGLAGPFLGGDRRPIWEIAMVAAMESIRTGRSARDEFHARLWDLVCQERPRHAATRAYLQDQAMLSFPSASGPGAIERYCRRVGTILTTAESVPALLATWAIERHPRRLDDLHRPELCDKHGLLEQQYMARFLGVTPNTLTQGLKRLRRRLGEEMRVLWGIDAAGAAGEDHDR